MPTIISGTTGVDKIQDNTVNSAKIVNASITAADLDTTYLTPTGDGSNLTGINTIKYVSTDYPAITTNGAVGDLWVNKSTGEVYCCTDETTNENVWKNVGAGSQAEISKSRYYYNDGTTDNYTGAFTCFTQVAGSTNYCTDNTTNWFLYNVGSSTTWMTTITEVYTAATFRVPPNHDKLSIYFYITIKESNGSDTGGNVYTNLGSTARGTDYVNHSMDTQIGSDDAMYITVDLDVPSTARGKDVYWNTVSYAGQYGNIQYNFYKIASYVDGHRPW